jgi:hypothetical protein
MNGKIYLSTFKTLCLAIIVAEISTPSFAQKLPDVQPAGLAAPQKVKVDGKLTEWNNALQAYNKSTKLNYTIANDDQNLYLAVKVTDPQNATKVMANGITLTINTGDKKKIQDAATISYPVVSRTALRSLRGQRRGFGSDETLTQAQKDSVTAVAHKQAIALAKEIRVTGIKDITDTLISIYNEYSIKVALAYDESGSLIYELSVPLKYLELNVDKPKEFAYNLTVNGMQLNNGGFRANTDGPGLGGGGGFGGGRGNGGGGGGNFGGGGIDMAYMMASTDFWGKYTLVKK